MSFSLLEGCTEKEKQALIAAMDKEMGHIDHVFPTQMNEAEYKAFKQAEIEHAPDVAVRIVNFRVQYYNTKTGEVVSEHI